MLIALVNSVRTHARNAQSGQIGVCPFLGVEVRACVGPFRQYWAYPGGKPQMPLGYENETPWHYSWKHLVRDESCEVVFGDNREHRADIVGNHGTVIELQHSPINADLAAERGRFYSTVTNRRLIWVIDAFEYRERITLLDPNGDDEFGKIAWKNKRLWVDALAASLDTHIFLDPKFVSNDLIKIWKFKDDLYWRYLTKRDFFMRHLNDVAKPEYADFSIDRMLVWKNYNS